MTTDIVNQFHETVCKYGDQTALTWKDEDLTFHEIDRQSDLVAGYLVSKGITSSHVGCYMKRTALWPIALFGLLKARCSYTPLDIANPKSRIQDIINDADISFVITDDACLMDFGDVQSEDMTHILAEGTLTDMPTIAPDDLAYIFYTSGTTGRPKGIPATHQQLSLVPSYWMQNVFHASAGEHVLQMAGMNFHISVMETIAFLVGGAHMFMIGDEEKKDPFYLANWLNEKRIERAFIAPAILTVLPHIELPYLKTIVIAGEPCPEHVRDYWIQQHMIVNTYGCTETTICIGSDIQSQDTPVNNVGRLNPALEGVIVDEELHEVPEGTAGELCIGGPSITTGYWHLPQINAEKFIENKYPSLSTRCRILFRTGDYVEKMPDGTLLHKGRIDDQIKLRGMRIETREIEIVLESHPSVEKAVVVAKTIKTSKRLVAYVKLRKDENTKLLKSHLATLLPDYMCPSIFVKMETFPVNINNKVMRSQLPEPVVEDHDVDRSSWSQTEIRISDIIGDLLEQKPEDLSDTFISLGGDSISSIVFADRINKAFHTNLNVWDLQKHQTIRDLSDYLDNSITVSEKKHPREERLDYDTLIELPQSLKDLWVSCMKSRQDNMAYQMFFAFSFDENTNTSLLEKAWNRVVEHQEALRLTFIQRHEKLIGKFIPYAYQALPVEDIDAKDFPEKSRSFYTQTELSFKERLFNARLFHLSDGKIKLCVVIHHLITDGLSYQLMHQQLMAYYEDAKDGRPSVDDAVSYRQYLEWKVQRENTYADSRLSFWKTYLNQQEPLFLKPAMGHSASNTVTKRFLLSHVIDEKFIELCCQECLTPAPVILSLFGYIVGKFVGQKDFVIAIASTDREEEVRFMNTMGYMVSMLLIRTLQKTASPFLTAVQHVAQQMLQARQNPIPLSEIMRITGAADGSDYINIGFGMENTRLDDLLSENIIQPAPFALTLYASITPAEISLAFQYNRQFFSDEAIDSMFKCFNYVLNQILSHPDLSLEQCELVTSPIEQLTVPSRESETDIPSFMSCFFQQVAEHPQNIAYRINGQDFTFEKLDRMSESVAISMQEILEGNELKNIGVCLKENDYLLPAIIGLFRQGACYVPIDATLPIERIRQMMEDAQIHTVISDNEVCTGFDDIHIIPITDRLFTQPSIATMRKTPSTETPAYIIFTSGSTGKPKGTLITHANLAAFCQNFIKLANLQTSTRTLQFASIGFDASILEIFPTLSVGAMVIFPTQDQRRSSQLLLKLLEEDQVSLALIPPSLLAILPYQQLPHLRTLLVGGEVSSKDLQERWRSGRTLINAYGPTENTVMATSMVMEHDTPHNNIGYPLDGVQCLVLDDRLRQLPNYAIGELCIGGRQLSAGYIHNPEQNHEHFINHPIWGRLYRSGDKVIRTNDGSFIFLGRIDSQVKIRGFRVELSEIIRIIESISGIHQAHVIMEGINRQARLIAYCVKDEGADISEQDVSNKLSTWLPQYMIPAAIVFMDSFPLTINNKIDETQLPKPTISSQYVAPMPGAEQQIADIACQLLGKDQISVTANLFYEGLTSILAMDLVWKMTQAGLTYSYSDIYKHKSIRQLVVNGLSKAWYWHNAETDKPIAVLVCGYTPMSPFYDDFIERLSQLYSVLVFDSFAFYYAAHPDQPCEAGNYTDFMREVVLAEIKKKGATVSVVTGHSIGSELGILLAEQIRQVHNPNVKVVAIGTSLYKMSDISKYLNDHYVILKQMEETMPPLVFNGELKLVLENRPSFSLFLNGDRDTQFLKKSETIVKKNHEAWKEKYPQATKLILDTDHFGILQFKYIDDIIALF